MNALKVEGFSHLDVYFLFCFSSSSFSSSVIIDVVVVVVVAAVAAIRSFVLCLSVDTVGKNVDRRAERVASCSNNY